MFIRIIINWDSLLHPLKSGGILHKFKNIYLRYKNGAGCCDIYSLYYYLGKKILPALKVFKENCCSYPSEMSRDEWEKILSKMIYSFEAIELDENCEKIDFKKQQEGFELFGKYYRNLWY